MVDDPLSSKECQILLRIARDSIEAVVKGERLKPLDLDTAPDALREIGASFVTLIKAGQLRGCIGSLEAYQPLAEDVREHAVAAATQDYRFPSVKEDEIAEIKIEISRLTKPRSLDYNDPQELIALLRPGIDGIVLRDGFRRATFLPQVWEKIKNPAEFLSHLCLKMGVPAETWRTKPMQVATYQVEKIQE